MQKITKKKIVSFAILLVMITHLIVLEAIYHYSKLHIFSLSGNILFWSYLVFFPIVLGLTLLFVFAKKPVLNKVAISIKLFVLLIMAYWGFLATMMEIHNPSSSELILTGLSSLIAGILAITLFIFELYNLRQHELKQKIHLEKEI